MRLGFIIIAVVVLVRLAMRFKLMPKVPGRKKVKAKVNKPMSPLQKKLFTVFVFARLNTRRFFRDRLALFFGILFPLIFLAVFGSISKGGGNISFNVALINNSNSSFATQFVQETSSNKIFKIDKSIHDLNAAEDKMTKSQLDGAIVLPANFGDVANGHPGGQVQVYYTQNDQQSGQTLATVLQSEFDSINAKYVKINPPFTVSSQQISRQALTSFDYTFSGLLGFSILGLGIFGPMNVFPELKKQGILRRFHTTPLRVWQYFLSTMISQAIIGLVSLAIMFAVAIAAFHLKVVGNWFELAVFLVYSIVLILGVGLSIGGWAKNERQAAPLGNIVVFPMMFLSGVFFPRFLMPSWLQGITGYIPLSPVIDGVRLMATEGKHLTDLGPQLGIMTIWLVVIYFIAFRVFRWE